MKILHRETFIALRARRTAHQIASAIANPALDLTQVYCSECRKELRGDQLDRNDRIACHRCGHINILPNEIAEQMRRELLFSDVHIGYPQARQTLDYHPQPIEQVGRAMWRQRDTVELVIWLLFVTCLVSLLVLLAG